MIEHEACQQCISLFPDKHSHAGDHKGVSPSAFCTTSTPGCMGSTAVSSRRLDDFARRGQISVPCQMFVTCAPLVNLFIPSPSPLTVEFSTWEECDTPESARLVPRSMLQKIYQEKNPAEYCLNHPRGNLHRRFFIRDIPTLKSLTRESHSHPPLFHRRRFERMQQPTQGTTDVSNNPEGLPLPPKEDAASDDTDPILTVTEVAGPSPEAEPETTDDPKTVGVKQLQGDEETQLAPTPNAENEAVMEGGEHAASSGVEDAGLEQPWSPVDTDGLSPKVDDHPGRATCGETDSVDPDEKAGECVNAITAAAAAVGEAGMGEESLAGGRVPAAAPEAPPSTEEDSPPVVLDSGAPAQNLDETVDGVSSLAGGKDDVDMRRSGTELSSAHEEAVVGATTAEMDEEGSMSLSVDDPSAACTEDSLTAGNSVAVADTEAVADRVSVADNAPVADDVSVADKLSAARGDESATPGVKESAEAAAEVSYRCSWCV